MTLITRLKGYNRTIVACDGQVNTEDHYPIRDGEQKLFIISNNISIGISGILSIDDFKLFDFLRDEFENNFDQSISISEFLIKTLNSINNEIFKSKNSYIFLSYIKNSEVINEIILNEGGLYFLGALDNVKDTLHPSVSYNFNQKYGIDLTDDTLMNTDIHTFIDINHDYSKGDKHGVYDPSQIYTILVLVFKKHGFELVESTIDSIDPKNLQEIMDEFYDIIDSTKTDRSIIPYESPLLRTIGKCKTIINVDPTGLEYIKN